MPDIIHFVIHVKYLQGTDLTFVGLEGTVLENDVMVLVKCYGVVLSTPDVCKTDVSQCYCVENFLGIKYWNYIL